MTAYYNEFDPKAAAWLRELIAAGLIAPGIVDTRSIADVRPADLLGFTQCHFFAGIGGWSLALRLAGWPDERPVWTGSCPCQPFSAAGLGDGAEDERHLWPAFYRLVAGMPPEHRPSVVFGEQVASALGRTWLTAVRADLEELGYAVGCADLCAAGAGAPHIRQRLWWVADAATVGHDGRGPGLPVDEDRPLESQRQGAPRRLGDGLESGLEGHAGDERDRGEPGRLGTGAAGSVAAAGGADGVADAGCSRREPDRLDMGGTAEGGSGEARKQRVRLDAGTGHLALRSPWADVAWLPCRDGTYRPTQPGLFPLAHGVSGRVGLLRGAGNAIVPEVAATFIEVYLDTLTERT